MGNFENVWTETILHVDMDSFFVEVERLGNPALLGIPVAVGGTGPRGVIASASYEARSFGVRSAQPTATARRLCPHLEVVTPGHSKYEEASAGVFAIFRSYTPLVEGLSLDEAYLDVGGLRRHYASSLDVANAIRTAIRDETGLPASVGVASSKLLAKLASERAKPDGLLLVPREGQLEFLSALPASALPGVGPATMAALQRLGVDTVADLKAIPPTSLARAIGPNAAAHLTALASGSDERRVEPDHEAKSVSVEETYSTDLEGLEVVRGALLALSHRLSSRLRRSGVTARTITLKVRFSGFETLTRSKTNERPLVGWHEIYSAALQLLDGIDPTRPVRLLGLGGSNLVSVEVPGRLDLDGTADWERVEEAVFEVRERFGDRSIRSARLVDENG